MVKKIVVMKFGGSSIATPEMMKKVAEHIKKTRDDGKRVVVVLSALGNTTDLLIQMAEAHYGGILPIELRREKDKLLVTGEEQSAPLLAITLESIGVKAVSLTSREISLEATPSGRVRTINDVRLIKNILDSGSVVIVTGFQGVKDGALTKTVTTLGRGGSDVTAVCLAAALGENYCENYTDVDGIFTTDPRIVSKAKHFEKISYHQLINMAAVGGGKLMDRAVLLAQNLGVQIRVLLSPSFGQSRGGTLVCSDSSLSNIEIENSQPGLAIQKLNMIKILRVPNNPGAAGKIFAALRDYNIRSSIQAPTETEEAMISILFSDDVAEDIIVSLEDLREELRNFSIFFSTKAVLTLVDPLMNERPGYLYDVCQALGDAGVNIISQASPGITIEVMVKLEDMEVAAQALAKKFKLTKE